MYSVKLTKYYSSNNAIKEGTPVSTSVQIVKGYDKVNKKELGNKIIKHLYYSGEKLEVKEKVIINEITDYKEIMHELDNLSLNKLKNNYYTDKCPECLEHWELEYDMFKIVGTYDNYIKELKLVEEILNFSYIINNLSK
jgi:hypothetical protein